MTTDPTDLLRQADTYLTVTHEHAARHDVIGEDFTCGGCALRKRIAALLAVPSAPAATDLELTAEEARSLADGLGLELYRAQDALAFVEECCVIADREGRTVTTAAVREWLKGARCGRQLAADAVLAVLTPGAPFDAQAGLRRLPDDLHRREDEPAPAADWDAGDVGYWKAKLAAATEGRDHLRRVADEAQQAGRAEVEPKRTPMDPVHILGIGSEDQEEAAALRARLLARLTAARANETGKDKVRCTCGGWFPIRHLHADTHQPAAETQQAGGLAEVAHGCPPDGSGLTPCCGLPPFELPLTDRISSEAPTTCTGATRPRCTCADVGAAFAPAGHYPDCPQAQQAGEGR